MARSLTAIIWTNVNQDAWSHCSRVTPHGVRHLGQHCLKWCLATISVPGRCLNQSWLLVNGTLNQSWLLVNGTLNQSWFLVNGTLKQSWFLVNGTLNQSWLLVNGTLNQSWLLVNGTLNQSWFLVNGTLINSLTRKRTRWHCSDSFANVFYDWKLVNFIQQLIKIHSLWCNWENVSIGWVNSSASNRRQAITKPTVTKMPETILVVWPQMMSDILVNIAWSINWPHISAWSLPQIILTFCQWNSY